jgi:sulfate transport system ATP-binding protein
MSIAIRHITKTFGEFRALDDVTLDVPTGELVAMLGPSGSGKTTLLRIIAGLEATDEGSGSIRFEEEDVAARDAGARGVGFVFQHYALFRHMTVFENVAFGLRVRPRAQRASRAAIRERVLELLRLVQLENLAGRYPSQLSGGQRQRVALARALAVEPKVLLLDEPFGALDAKVRAELRRWLRRLHDEIHLTSLFVTHDQEEALEVADRIVVLNKGRIEQIGTPEEVFHHPASAFVIDFLGNVNLFHGRIDAGKAVFGGLSVDVAGDPATTQGRLAHAFVRPHELDISIEADDARPGMPATVRHVRSAGPQTKIELEGDGGERIVVELPHERFRALNIAAGARIFVTPREVKVFTDDYSI